MTGGLPVGTPEGALARSKGLLLPVQGLPVSVNPVGFLEAPGAIKPLSLLILLPSAC